MKYKIYTEEVQRVHGEYLVTADSEEEAIKKFDEGYFDDTPEGDIWDNEVINVDIEVYEED